MASFFLPSRPSPVSHVSDESEKYVEDVLRPSHALLGWLRFSPETTETWRLKKRSAPVNGRLQSGLDFNGNREALRRVCERLA